MSQNTDWKKKSQDIFKLLNDFRKNPKLLAKHLEGLLKYLDKNNVLSEPNKIPIQMVEGNKVIKEAVNFLNSIKPLPAFILDPSLCSSAQEHVDDIGPKGLLSYQSSDGTEPEERITKYGNYFEALGENIDFGPNDALGVIVSLTLDDGEEERPHRDNLFKADYKKIGIACGVHASEYQMCVMDFAFDFIPHGKITESTKTNDKFESMTNHSKQQENQLNQNSQPQLQSKVIKNQVYNQALDLSDKQYNKNIELNTEKENKINMFEDQPIVKVNLDNNNSMINEISKINNSKRVLSKYVEVITKTIITYEDGCKKEVTEKEEHTFTY